jgi:hypothetical protein
MTYTVTETIMTEYVEIRRVCLSVFGWFIRKSDVDREMPLWLYYVFTFPSSRVKYLGD